MSILLSLAAAGAALLALFGFVRFFDLLAGGWRHFAKAGPNGKGVLAIIHRDPVATAVYYGLRFVGAGIAVGLVVSAVRFAL